MKAIAIMTVILFSVLFSNCSHCPVRKAGFVADSEYIKDLKNFWVKIYTEVSVDETVIHDRFNPNVIYSIASHKGASWNQRKKIVRKELRRVRALLNAIYKKSFINLTQEENEVYQRVLGHIELKDFISLSRRARGQQGMKEKFKKGIEVSYLYLEHIKKIFRDKGVPEELAYLPHVESSFNYKAYSKVGAAGIWQFMRRSGKHYKLKINKTVDERLDPLKAAEAAANMLKDNYKILRSWPLAITGYNHGPYGIRKATRRVKSSDLTVILLQYKSRSFSFASRNFYASFLGAIEVAQNYNAYYDALEKDNLLTFEEYTLDQKIRVKSVLKKQELSWSEFKHYNPFVKKRAYTRNYYLAKGTKLKLPVGNNVDEEVVSARQLEPVVPGI